MKQIFKIFSLAAVLICFFSCREDLSRSGDGNASSPESAAYKGPMVNLGVNIKSSYGKDSRFFKIDLKEGTSEPNLLQLKWKKGEHFTVLGCIRRKYAPSDWHKNVDYVTARLEGVVTENSNGAMKMQITGTFHIPEDWIQGGHFKDPAMYFGAYYVQKGGLTLAGMDINSNEESVTVNPSGFIGIQNGYDKKRLPAFNVLVGIPLTRIMLAETTNRDARAYDFKKVEDPAGETVTLSDDTQPTTPAQNQTYISKPAGSLIHIRLRNEFAFPVRFPLSAKLRTQSFLGFDKSVPYDFWTYVDERQKAIGTSAYNYHFGGTPFSQSDTEDNSIAYYLKDSSSTDDNKRGQDVVLQPGDFVDLYSMAPVNRNWHGNPVLTIDFSSLNIEIKNNNQTWVSLKNAAYGADRETYVVKAGSDNALKESVNYLKFVSKKPNTSLYPDGKSRYLPFDLKSDLMISAVGYKWDNVDKNRTDNASLRSLRNYGVIQLSNINKESISLNNYYLARIVYGRDSRDPNKIQFKTATENGWLTDNFAYALLMPLMPSGSTQTEISPNGSNDNGKYTVQTHSNEVSEHVYPYIASNKVGVFLANGFDQDANTNWDKFSSQYPSMVVDKNNSQVCTSYSILENHRGKRENDQLIYPWDKYSGVMARANGDADGTNTQQLGGWALVKKDGDSYRIIDTFGPIINGFQGAVVAPFKQNFGGALQSPIEFLRLPTVFFPSPQMDVRSNRVTSGSNESALENAQWRSYRYGDYKNFNGPKGFGTRYWK